MILEALQLLLAFRLKEGERGKDLPYSFHQHSSQFLALTLAKTGRERRSVGGISDAAAAQFQHLGLFSYCEAFIVLSGQSPGSFGWTFWRLDSENTLCTTESLGRCSGSPLQQAVIVSQTGSCSHWFWLGFHGRRGRFPSLISATA